MWNIARSAEAMFSRWAVKRVLKFLLKKKLGHFILGEIDLDQLDVQLGAGTVQLSDLALNVDYINQKFGTAAGVIVKEGSIGFLSVKMPWKGNGCQIEVDELEVVLTPRMEGCSAVGAGSFSGRDSNSCTSDGMGKLDHELVDHNASSASAGVHEGVKTIAKMVKWLLTSFHVKIKRLLVAFDPCLDNDEKKIRSQMTMVLRITEIECGTCLSEDVNSEGDGENFLGISKLTSFASFQGAVVELLQMSEVDKNMGLLGASGSTFGELFSKCCRSTATIPILAGEPGGFSGTLKLSIPWKNGSLDICKVDSEVYVDPVELKLQPRILKWLILTWESHQNLDIDGKRHMAHKATDSVYYHSVSHFHSSALGSSVIASDKALLNPGNSYVDLCSPRAAETMANLISDWVPFSVDKKQKENAEEADFSASLNQFFDCFDEMRCSQSASSSSGIWNWTSSVFSVITAASNLASGSLQSPSEKQHVQTNLKATISGISVVFSFGDEQMKHLCFLNGGQNNFGPNAHFLGGICQDVNLVLQVCPQEIRVEATVKHIEVADYFSDGIDIIDSGFSGCNSGIFSKTLLMQYLQAEVQGALLPLASSTEDSVQSNGLIATDFPFRLSSLDGYVCKTDCESIKMNDLVKVMLLTSSGVGSCQCTVSSSYSGDGSTRSVFFSLDLPPFVLWVNFNLMNMLLDCWKEFGNSFETKNSRDGVVPEASDVKHGSSCQGSVKRGYCPYIATSSPKESLRGNIILCDARVMLCFPFENSRDFRCYPPWDQFIALNFSSPLTLHKKKDHDANAISHANAQKYSLTTSHSLNLNFGKFDLYLVTSGQKCDAESNFCSLERKRFSAHNVLCVENETGSASLISMIWHEGSVTGPWLVNRVKAIAASGNLGSENKVIGKGHEFASVTTMKDVEDSKFCLRREMVMSSAFFLHAYLPPATVNLDSSLYNSFYCLLNQAIDGLSCVSCDSLSKVEDSTVSQMSLLVECDSVEIIICPDMEKVPKGSIQDELPGSWHHIKLKIQKFELLSVSNIGGIRDASFFWVGHGEGKLWGSVTGTPGEELLLISCSNSAMRRGDGGGSNAISYGLAGSDIIHLWDPGVFDSFTSMTIRCGTIVAIGGRLDWLEAISSFFSLASPGNDRAGDTHLPKSDSNDNAPLEASFVLNLVDIGLSYEPYLRNLSTSGEISKFDSSSEVQVEGDKNVACLLAAASLYLSNVTMADSISNDYEIRVRDLGLLLSAVFRPDYIVSSYSVENLHKFGYVKVAGEAFLEATLRMNCKNGLLWELECSESHTHIIFDTCHDTTAGLVRLVTQLQQLFSPDVEESIVHLQARWNNVQQAHERNDLNNEMGICDTGSGPSASNLCNRESEPGVFGLMDEICEDAFHLDRDHLHASNSRESQCHNLLDGTILGEACNVSITFPESCSDHGQTSFLENGCIPEMIECFYRPELLPPSELSVTHKSSKEAESKSRTMERGGMNRENVGWYGDTSLRIVENHISEMWEENVRKQFIEGKLPCTTSIKADDCQRGRGRILLKNINVRWRMHAGSDWLDLEKLQSASVCGRDKTVCLELALFGIDFQYIIFPEGQLCASKLSLSVQDIHLYDNSIDAPWKMVLGYYDSKGHPRESSSKAFKLDLEAVRPDPSIPLDEYRLRIAFLPMLLHLHQIQVDFLINFFGEKKLPAQQSLVHPQEIGGSKLSTTKCDNFRRAITEEALLPYFQKFDIWPVVVRVDYTPARVDLAALRGGKYAELVNLVPWKGVELQLKQVHAVGVYGWSTVFETIIGDWLEDISQNQIHKLLQGLPPIRSLVAVGSGAAKLISFPVKSYRKDHRLLKGMQRGTVAFLKSISLEAVGLGLHLSAEVHEILHQAEYILASIPPSVPLAMASRTKNNMRFNQPKDAQQGLQQACESLSDGLGRSASALVQVPLKSYQRGAGAGSVLATAVRAAPAAAIAPASAAASAVHFALLGVRNSLDPEHKRESMEKYRGPTQPWEHS